MKQGEQNERDNSTGKIALQFEISAETFISSRMIMIIPLLNERIKKSQKYRKQKLVRKLSFELLLKP